MEYITDSLDWWLYLLHSGATPENLQACVLSLLLFTLHTHNCNPHNVENSAVNFADKQTTLRIHIWRKSTVLQRFSQGTTFCSVSTKPMTDRWFLEKEGEDTPPLCISRAEVKQVNSFRFLGVSITDKLSWSSHISTLVKKASKQLYFLRKLKRVEFMKNHSTAAEEPNFLENRSSSFTLDTALPWVLSKTPAK